MCLPGTPDLVFPRLRKVVNVNGCFWHAHGCKRGRRVPKSNRAYWLRKRRRNAGRDRRTGAALKALGWRVLTVWECELGVGPGRVGGAGLARRLRRFLAGGEA